jgi:hypothetical protein
MLSKLHLVQKVHLPCDSVDLEKLTVNRRRGQIDKSALRTFLGNQLLRQVLLQYHDIKPDLIDKVQSRLHWRVRLLEHPSRISISYWTADREGKQSKRFRILFKSERVPKTGYILTPQSFRRGDEN